LYNVDTNFSFGSEIISDGNEYTFSEDCIAFIQTDGNGDLAIKIDGVEYGSPFGDNPQHKTVMKNEHTLAPNGFDAFVSFIPLSNYNSDTFSSSNLVSFGIQYDSTVTVSRDMLVWNSTGDQGGLNIEGIGGASDKYDNKFLIPSGTQLGSPSSDEAFIGGFEV
jgi:hypothetical protein